MKWMRGAIFFVDEEDYSEDDDMFLRGKVHAGKKVKQAPEELHVPVKGGSKKKPPTVVMGPSAPSTRKPSRSRFRRRTRFFSATVSSLLARGEIGRRSLRTKPFSKARFEMEVSRLGTRPRVVGSSQLEWYNSMCRGRRGLSKAVIMETTRAAWASSTIVAMVCWMWRRSLHAADERRAPTSGAKASIRWEARKTNLRP